jgi:hypothetical protein
MVCCRNISVNTLQKGGDNDDDDDEDNNAWDTSFTYSSFFHVRVSFFEYSVLSVISNLPVSSHCPFLSCATPVDVFFHPRCLHMYFWLGKSRDVWSPEHNFACSLNPIKPGDCLGVQDGWDHQLWDTLCTDTVWLLELIGGMGVGVVCWRSASLHTVYFATCEVLEYTQQYVTDCLAVTKHHVQWRNYCFVRKVAGWTCNPRVCDVSGGKIRPDCSEPTRAERRAYPNRQF